MTIEVTDAPEAKRFEARVDGKLAGFIQYEMRADAVVLVHTEVLEEYEGKGVGSVLVRRVLDDIRPGTGRSSRPVRSSANTSAGIRTIQRGRNSLPSRPRGLNPGAANERRLAGPRTRRVD